MSAKQKPLKFNYPIKPYKVTLLRLQRELAKKQVGSFVCVRATIKCGVDCYTRDPEPDRTLAAMPLPINYDACVPLLSGGAAASERAEQHS
jgi:hypothetical protein